MAKMLIDADTGELSVLRDDGGPEVVWFRSDEPDEHDVCHLLPLGDDRPHFLLGCPCGADSNDAPDGWMYHRSFDGREAFEEGRRRPS